MLIDLKETGRLVNPDHVVWGFDADGVLSLTLVSYSPSGRNEVLTLRGKDRDVFLRIGAHRMEATTEELAQVGAEAIRQMEADEAAWRESEWYGDGHQVVS